MIFTLTIPEPTPSLNQFFYEQHWKKRYQEKKKWSVLLLFAVKNTKNYEMLKAHGKRKLTIQRHGKRALDNDNGLGGCKVVIDALRLHGLILDDDDKNLSVSFENCKLEKGKAPYTVLVIEDL